MKREVGVHACRRESVFGSETVVQMKDRRSGVIIEFVGSLAGDWQQDDGLH
jgi:hypothetical protein